MQNNSKIWALVFEQSSFLHSYNKWRLGWLLACWTLCFDVQPFPTLDGCETGGLRRSVGPSFGPHRRGLTGVYQRKGLRVPCHLWWGRQDLPTFMTHWNPSCCKLISCVCGCWICKSQRLPMTVKHVTISNVLEWSNPSWWFAVAKSKMLGQTCFKHP